LSIILLISINGQKHFIISGNLSGFETNALAKITKNNITLDSCIIKDGQFLLKGTLENVPTSVVLFIKNGDNYKYSELFIGNESITINADIDDFKWNVRTKGSKYDDLRFDYFQLIKNLSKERENIENEIFTLRDHGKWNDSLQSAYWNRKEPFGKIILVDRDIEEINKKFIADNINNYYGLYLLDANKVVLPKKFVSQTYNKIKPELKKSVSGKSLYSFIYNPDLNIGERFLDFVAYNKSGKKVRFSKYFNSKFVLLDFSTPYCGFCLESVPILNKLKKDNPKKLEIVTFYVDENPKGFEKLDKKHTPGWETIWDKKGRLGETYSKYKIDGTPILYLFSPDGKLIEKFDGFDEDLGALIEKKL